MELEDSSRRRRPAGLPWFRVPGLYLRLREDPLRALTKLRDELGGVVRVPLGPIRLFFLSDPDAIQRVLLENQANYSKRTRDYEAMKPVLGEGLLTSDGALWQRQRRTIQPAFHHTVLDRFADLITRETEETLRSWRPAAARGEALDLAREMSRLALTIVGKALFGVDLSTGADALGPAVTLLNQHIAEDAARIFELPHWVPTARNRKFRNAKRTVDLQFVAEASDRPPHGDGPDLIGMLRRARDPETGEAMSERQLRDEIVTMMAAGHETTANALAWTLYLLSLHPEVTEALQRELDAVGTRDSGVPTLEDFDRMALTKMVLQESMRLYPPAWGLSRRAERADVVEGHSVAPGSFMQVIIYLLHRNPDVWEEPERFDPTRFRPERIRGRHRFAYLPFGAGSRICIGKDFAMMEAQLILAMVLKRYRVALAPGHPIALEPIITLRPRHGMWMHLEER
jgi:cytochrome P450